MFNNLFSKNAQTNSIRINGKTIAVTGNNISVVNNKVYVDGKLVGEGLSGNVTITFEGDVANLKTNGSATINGNVQGEVDAGGSVKVSGDVGGDVAAGGSVTCGNVKGDVDAGGSIRMNR